jgi:beta-galactosidase
MKFGVCYYPEHWPAERWPIDAKLMRESGISIVRIGEFAWAQMEPSEGQFEWHLLDQVIETLAVEGLEIVLGTPTAAPPAWLVKAYPEVLPVDADGRQRRFGSRRHYCPNSSSFRNHTKRIVTNMAKVYGENPAVIGWQIDNEIGCHGSARCYCKNCIIAFRRWLEFKYQNLDVLNEAWGTAFWSQIYSDWNQVEPPNLTVAEPNPSHVLDYYRFSSDSWVSYQQIQIDLLRKYSPGRFLTHNFLSNFPDLDAYALAQPLDIASWDSYPTGHTEEQADRLYSPNDQPPTYVYDLGDPAITSLSHNITRGQKQRAFWVMEQQCGNINWSKYNTGIRAGTVRLWTWHAISSGAEAVVYFRWRASLIGHEQHHSGLLKHDGSPDIGYQELVYMQAELPEMAEIASSPLNSKVAILLDYNSLWALQQQPHHKDFDYLSHLFIYHRALQQLGITADIVSPEADLSSYKIVIAHTQWLGTESLAKTFMSYTENGGILLLGVRSGFKTSTNLVTADVLPGPFRNLLGTTVTSWIALPPEASFDIDSNIPELTGPAVIWAESLDPVSNGNNRLKARALARYTSGPLSSQTALTENQVGDGRAFYLGWYPTVTQAKAILKHLVSLAGLTFYEELPSGLVTNQRDPYTILLNFTEQPLTVNIPGQKITIDQKEIAIINSNA